MANEIDPIIIDLISLGGYAPVYWKSDYPRYGNKNHAGRMENVDMKSPDSITQAPALAILTAGDEDGAITTLVKRIMQTAESLNVTYAVGGNKIQKLSSTAVTNTGSFPATIDKGGVTGEDAEDNREDAADSSRRRDRNSP